MPRPPSDIPDRVLDAALFIAADEGASSLTIDAVAKAAGVSKGGVLHHFKTKDALVRGLVERLVLQFEEAMTLAQRGDKQPVGRFVRGFLRTMENPMLASVGRALLAAVAHNPDLLQPLRDHFNRCHERIQADGLDPSVAYECVLVSAALWYEAIFQLPPPPQEVVDALRAKLLAKTLP